MINLTKNTKPTTKTIAFSIALTNLGMYNEGTLCCEWLDLPASQAEINTALKKIQIGSIYEEYFITDYDSENFTNAIEGLGEYENINKLNALAQILIDADDPDKINAILEFEYAKGAADIANIVLNLDCYSLYYDVENEYDLGYYWIEESGCYDFSQLGNLSNYFDYEKFGHDIAIETEGTFTSYGYIERIDSIEDLFDIEDYSEAI